MGEECRVGASLLVPSPRRRSGHEVLWDNPTHFARRARGVQPLRDPTCPVRSEGAEMGSSFTVKRCRLLAGVLAWDRPRSNYLSDLDGGGSARPGHHRLSHPGVFGAGREWGSRGEPRRHRAPLGVGALFQHRLQIAKQLSGLTSSAQRAHCAADAGERSWPPAIPGAAGRQRDAGGA